MVTEHGERECCPDRFPYALVDSPDDDVNSFARYRGFPEYPYFAVEPPVGQVPQPIDGLDTVSTHRLTCDAIYVRAKRVFGKAMLGVPSHGFSPCKELSIRLHYTL